MSVADTAPSAVMNADDRRKIRQVISASSVGTVIEWYDFYIFGSLAATLAPKFYPEGNDTFALIAYLSTFAVGFLVRPFGAAFFGRIGDLVGRKYAFLLTLLIMGGATASIGLLPTYHTIGVIAPILLIAIRVAQGLALGGEYGGAAVYVAEHVPDAKRGYYTSFIQITATAGLFLSLGVILITQSSMADSTFKDWGWRIPFLASIFLVGVSLFIRLRMKESPLFTQLKAQGKASLTPLKDAFATKENRRRMAVSLFGATMGQGVVWYTGQFYALFYLQTVLGIQTRTANIIVAVALLLAVPLFVVVGGWSDRVGRKKIMLSGMVLAAVSYIPIYKLMQMAAGNDIVSLASTQNPITKEYKLLPQTLVDGVITPFTGTAPNPNVPALIALVFVQVCFVCLVYGPIAAYLVEAFPAKVRYTSMSLPYHIGNGVFGGMLPLIGLTICAWTGSMYAGLSYPIVVALLCAIIGWRVLPETRAVRIWDEVDGTTDAAAAIDLREEAEPVPVASSDGEVTAPEASEDAAPAPGSST
jgi:MFS family permease